MTKRISITETVSATISGAERTRLQESTSEAVLPKKIVTIVEGIHSGLTRNNTFYPAETLEASRTSWFNPYNKPVIKNHDESTEPLGRVINATYKQSNIAPDKQTLELELEITDEDTIRKVLDGRYQTLSIGGSAGAVACSICAMDQVKEGYCGHDKGRTYEGKKAYWIIADLAFDEISWVNVPADVNAQVVHRDASQQTESKGTEQGGLQLDNPQTDVLDQIDVLRQQEAVTATDTLPIQDEADTSVVTGEDAGAQTEDTATTTDEVSIQEKLTQSEARVVTLESENTTLVAERDTFSAKITELEAEVTKLKEQVSTLNQDNVDSAQEKVQLVKQNTTLATYTHKVLAENLAGLQVVLGKVEEDKKDEAVQSLLKESSRSLKDKISELTKERPQRVITHVDNPAHAAEEITESAVVKEEKEFTIEDFASAFSRVLNKQQN